MGIRRQLKNNKNSFSLYRLLNEIERNSSYISKEYFISLYNVDKKVGLTSFNQTNGITAKERKVVESTVKREISEGERQRAEKEWEELVGADNDPLLPEVVKNELKKLKSLGKKIEDLADKYIAHIDKRRKDPQLNLDDFNKELPPNPIWKCACKEMFEP